MFYSPPEPTAQPTASPTPPKSPRMETALEAAAKELVAKFKAAPDELKEQYNRDLKNGTQQLIKDGRDDLLWIVALSVEKGEINSKMVRDRMKRKPWFKTLETETATSGISINDAIRTKFLELSERKIGDFLGEGDRLTYLLFIGDGRVITEYSEYSGYSEDSEDSEDSGQKRG